MLFVLGLRCYDCFPFLLPCGLTQKGQQVTGLSFYFSFMSWYKCAQIAVCAAGQQCYFQRALLIVIHARLLVGTDSRSKLTDCPQSRDLCRSDSSRLPLCLNATSYMVRFLDSADLSVKALLQSLSHSSHFSE